MKTKIKIIGWERLVYKFQELNKNSKSILNLKQRHKLFVEYKDYKKLEQRIKQLEGKKWTKIKSGISQRLKMSHN